MVGSDLNSRALVVGAPKELCGHTGSHGDHETTDPMTAAVSVHSACQSSLPGALRQSSQCVGGNRRDAREQQHRKPNKAAAARDGVESAAQRAGENEEDEGRN